MGTLRFPATPEAKEQEECGRKIKFSQPSLLPLTTAIFLPPIGTEKFTGAKYEGMHGTELVSGTWLENSARWIVPYS